MTRRFLSKTSFYSYANETNSNEKFCTWSCFHNDVHSKPEMTNCSLYCTSQVSNSCHVQSQSHMFRPFSHTNLHRAGVTHSHTQKDQPQAKASVQKIPDVNGSKPGPLLAPITVGKHNLCGWDFSHRSDFCSSLAFLFNTWI